MLENVVEFLEKLSEVIKIDLRIFLVTTLIGSTIRNGFYFLGGYAGSYYLDQFGVTLEQLELVGYLLILLAVIYFLHKQSILQKLYSKLKC